MNNFSVQHDGKTYWIARNVAVACFVFAPVNGEWCVLANQRGKGAADFQGYWNAPCGYLDFDETTKQAAMREVYEETGVKLKNAHFLYFKDSPYENLQNVTFIYYSIISNPQVVNNKTENRGGEKDEVNAISWIPIKNLERFNWAFNHKGIIETIINELELF